MNVIKPQRIIYTTQAKINSQIRKLNNTISTDSVAKTHSKDILTIHINEEAVNVPVENIYVKVDNTLKQMEDIKMSKGLDIGTAFLAVAEKGENNDINIKSIRDAFIDLEKGDFVDSMLTQTGVKFIKKDETIYVVGDEAIELSSVFNKAARRPLAKGVINPKDKEAITIIKILLEKLIGKGEGKLYYSVPAKPVDADYDTVYHEGEFKKILTELGYSADPINEGLAVIYSELEKDNYTGIGISCLCPGTKIYTKRGLLNIEDVIIGDEVITHKGRYKKITDIITKNFDGVATKLQLLGYSNNTNDLKFVDNHELYVRRNNNWNWVGCENLIEGDIVGEPILNRDFSKNKHTITICERITSSKEYIKTQYTVSQNFQRLIGYFLGDGSVNCDEGCIQFDFDNSEIDNINDIHSIIKDTFNKNCASTIKSENCTRVKCYSKGITSWFKNHCYDKNSKKQYPFELDKLSYGDCINLLAGLIRSDGSINEKNIVFYNTNSHLVFITRQCLSKLGYTSAISYREPREHLYEKEDRIIKGSLIEYSIASSGKRCYISLKDFITNVNSNNNMICEKMFIEDGFLCTFVQKIENEEYNGIVYDLKVEDDHSFSAPFLTIHNCGAGMINICFSYLSIPIFSFSIARSGDWIDNEVAVSTNTPISKVCLMKEQKLDLITPTDNNVLTALQIVYENLITYMIKHIKRQFDTSENLPSLIRPIPVVISGGTSMPKGFIEKFTEIWNKYEFPCEISEIRHCSEPLYAVAKGALRVALAKESKG